MSGSTTGIAPGFGGFAVTPDGQAQYMARRYNPYAFLQQPLGQQMTDTAPAAEQSFAGGGLVPLQAPGGLTAATRFMRLRSKGYRGGGFVRFDDGGSTGNDGGSDNGSDGSASANGPGDSASSGQSDNASDGSSTATGPGDPASSGGYGSLGGGYGGFGAGGPGAQQGPGLGPEGGIGAVAGGQAAAMGSMGSLGPGQETGQTGGAGLGSSISGPVSFGGMPVGNVTSTPKGPENPDEPTAAQVAGLAALGAAKGALGGVPGAGFGLGKGVQASGMLDGVPSAAVSAASTLGTIGGAIGFGLGGPLGGAALGGIAAGIGAVAGPHGENGPGALGGTKGGTTTDNNDVTGTGTTTSADDLASTIRRIKSALSDGGVQGLASGGRVRGGRGVPNHAFHQGSGLVHGTSDGRADALYTHVPPGGYVVPADVVSGLGQGNTLAGAKKLTQAMPAVGPNDGAPNDLGMASGGAVPVRLSAGEFYVHPRHVAALGGSGRLDGLVNQVRQQSVRQVSAMPPPR